jgi:hypothetical protein
MSGKGCYRTLGPAWRRVRSPSRGRRHGHWRDLGNGVVGEHCVFPSEGGVAATSRRRRLDRAGRYIAPVELIIAGIGFGCSGQFGGARALDDAATRRSRIRGDALGSAAIRASSQAGEIPSFFSPACGEIGGRRCPRTCRSRSALSASRVFADHAMADRPFLS